MILGGPALGERELGAAQTVSTSTIWPRQYTLDQPVADLNLDAVLTFYEIPLSGASYIRVVNFSDHDAENLSTKIAFNGTSWTFVHVTRTEIEEAIDGSQPEISVTVLDFDHTVIDLVEQYDGLGGHAVDVYIIENKNIGTPSLATTWSFVIKRVTSSEGPARVTFTLGSPTFADYQFPRVYFNRHTCPHEYQQRHTHNNQNWCDYPSDQFQLESHQVFGPQAAATETELYNGWYALNGDACVYARSGILGGVGWDARSLYVYDHAGQAAQWDGATRTGFFAYKAMDSDDEADVSVCAKLRISSSYDEAICGLLVQSADDETDWVFFGLQYDGANTNLLWRETASSVSTDTVHDSSTSYTAVKISRGTTGGIWTLYAKTVPLNELDAEDDYSWTSLGYETDPIGSTDDLRVGVVVCADATGTKTFDGDIFYYRVMAGGKQTCRRTLTDCTAHGNTTQFGGYLGLPDGIVDWK